MWGPAAYKVQKSVQAQSTHDPTIKTRGCRRVQKSVQPQKHGPKKRTMGPKNCTTPETGANKLYNDPSRLKLWLRHNFKRAGPLSNNIYLVYQQLILGNYWFRAELLVINCWFNGICWF